MQSAGSSGKSEHLVFQRHENTQTIPSCLGLSIIYDPNNRGQAKAPILRPMSDSYCRFLEQKLWAIIPGRILVFSFSLPYLFLLGQCGYYMALTRTNSCRNPKRRAVYLLNCITRYLSWRLLNYTNYVVHKEPIGGVFFMPDLTFFLKKISLLH